MPDPTPIWRGVWHARLSGSMLWLHVKCCTCLLLSLPAPTCCGSGHFLLPPVVGVVTSCSHLLWEWSFSVVPICCGSGHFLFPPAVLSPTTRCVGVARIGSDNEGIVHSTLQEMVGVSMGPPLHSLIIVGPTHPMEDEILHIFSRKH